MKAFVTFLIILGIVGLLMGTGSAGVLLAIPVGITARVAAMARHSRARSALRRNYEAGRCLNCGYDVRANLARCPECGDELFWQVLHYYDDRMKPL